MRALLVCATIHHGNTMRVAEAIADGLGAEVRRPWEVSADELGRYELVGLGSGIYYGRHHSSLFKLVRRARLIGVRAFVLYTSGFPRVPVLNGCDASLKRLLAERGAEVLDSFGCRGYCDYGPLKLVGGINRDRPSEEDLEAAKAFARRLMERLARPSANT